MLRALKFTLLMAIFLVLAVACGGGGGGDNGGGTENQAPSASAGLDQTVLEGATVTLNGSSSTDSDGTIAAYSWSQTTGPSVTLSSESAVQPTFTAPAVDAATVLTFTLTVTDDDGATDTDTVIVTVNDIGSGENLTPTASAGPDQTVDEGAAVTLNGSGSSDPDGTIAAWSWAQLAGPSVTLSDAGAASSTFTAPLVDTATVLTFELTVTDNESATASDTVTITVNNVAPVVPSTTINGVLRDRDGAPIAGATVVLQEQGAFSAGAPLPRANSKYSRTALINAARAKALSSTARMAALTSIAFTVTDENGFYTFADVAIPESGKLLISFDKSGYASYQELLTLTADAMITVQAMMAQAYVAPVQDASAVITVTADSTSTGVDNAGMNLTVPAGSLLDSSGAPVTGDVQVEVAVADPANEADRAIFPGSFAAADAGQDLNNPATTLESVAFAEITIRDVATGEEYTTIDPANPATVEFLLPVGIQDGTILNPNTGVAYVAGDKIPWWSYNEDMGVWEREDANPNDLITDPADPAYDADVVARADGLYVQANVVHFTWWNGDHPIDRSYLNVHVNDDSGNPLPNVLVKVNGVTYNSRARSGVTNASGDVNGLIVKGSVVASVTEQCQVTLVFNGIEYPQSVMDTPPQEQTVSVTYVIGIPGTIQGTVTDAGGNPLSGVLVYTDLMGSLRTDALGQYSIKVPYDRLVNVHVNGAVVEDRSGTATVATPVVTLDFTFPAIDLTSILAKLEGDETTPGDPIGAYKDLKQLADSGQLDNNGRALWAVLSFFELAEQAKTSGTSLNTLIESVGLKAYDDPVTGEFRIVSVTEACLEWDYSAPGPVCSVANPFYNPDFTMTAIPDYQNLAQLIQAKIDYSRAILAQINGPVTLVVDGMEVDDSDIIGLNAVLDLADGLLEYIQGYQFTLNTYAENGDQQFSPLNLQDLLQRPDVATRFANSKALLNQVFDGVVAYLDAMELETDIQSDDIIYIDAEMAVQLPKLLEMLDGFKASVNSTTGWVNVPIYEWDNKRITSAVMGNDGTFTIDETADLFKGYLKLDLSTIFDPARMFDGSKLAADITSGAFTVTPVDDFYGPRNPDYFAITFAPESHAGTLITSVFGDAEFALRDSRYATDGIGGFAIEPDTRILLPFTATAGGAPEFTYYFDSFLNTWVKEELGLSEEKFDNLGVSLGFPFDTGTDVSWTETNVPARVDMWGDSWSQSDTRPMGLAFTFSYLYSGTLWNSPLTVGATWTNDNMWVQGYQGYTATSTVTAIESVTVPLNTYANAIKTVTVISGAGTSWEGAPAPAGVNNFINGTRTTWHAPNMGIVKMVYDHADGKQTVAELTSQTDGTGALIANYVYFRAKEGGYRTYTLTNPYDAPATVSTETCTVQANDPLQPLYRNWWTAMPESIATGYNVVCTIDPGPAPTTWYLDSDGDGFGSLFATPVFAVDQPAGYVANPFDCDDSVAAINPDATEILGDFVDNNCNFQTDEDGTLFTWYFDGDGDGWGDPFNFTFSDVQPGGYVSQPGDCSNWDPSVNPGATEIKDWLDNDCDQQVDEGFSQSQGFFNFNLYRADEDNGPFGGGGGTQPMGPRLFK
ncbi:hypothetical protein EPN96_07570 [bacterium]|nr:MAG: hypothetical protein EPN96_07570 [bacterium]